MELKGRICRFKVAIWSVEVLFFCNEGNILLSCWSDLIWMKITCNSNWFIEQSPSYILRLVFFCVRTKIHKNDRKYTKNTFIYLFLNYLQDRNIFYWDNWILHPQKHMYRHQVCDSNCIRTQVMAQNVISKFQWRPFGNGLK